MTHPRNQSQRGDCLHAIGLKVLKDKRSEYVRLTASAETVLVTDRDRVVAGLVLPREGRSTLPADVQLADVQLADAQLADAVRHGWITPPMLIPAGIPTHVSVASLAELLTELHDDRSER